MKKIKQFFRDVIGEIKEPSEDAGKVLGVIRRVMFTVIAVVLFLKLTSTPSTIYFRIIPYMQIGFANFANSLALIVEWAFDFITLAAYFIFFV